MQPIWEFASRVMSLFRKRTLEDELSEELRHHLELTVEEYIRRGMPEHEAWSAARRSFGGIEQAKEHYRKQRGIPMIETLLQDLKYGLRVLRKNPGFSAIAILSLALGIGANTAIFQLTDALALRALPVQNPQQLAEIKIINPEERSGMSVGRHPILTTAEWDQIKANQQVFSGVLAWSVGRFNLNQTGEVRFAQGLVISGDAFNVLGIQPVIGRLFSEQDDQRGCAAGGVVISQAFWQSEFGGSTDVIGKRMTLNGNSFEVIGVTPESFYGLEVGRRFDVAVPMCADSILTPTFKRLERRNVMWLAAIGRLKPGIRVEQATAQLTSISPALFKETLPPDNDPKVDEAYLNFKLGAFAAPSGLSDLREKYSNPLFVLMAITGLVLLIACANIANLMLARATARQREIAIRLSLGASRGRLIRQLLSESLLLAVIGGITGIFIAKGLSQTLVSLFTTRREVFYLDLGMNWQILFFAIGLSVLTCALFGLVPAIRATGDAPAEAMKMGGRGSTVNRERFGLRRILVVSQVALSLVLLIGALLFVRTLQNLYTVDSGLRGDGVLVSGLDLVPVKLPKERLFEYKRNVLQKLRQIPGVESAAEADIMPISGSSSNGQIKIANEEVGRSQFNTITDQYFQTVGTPILAGRDFGSLDTENSPKVAIVNEAFARSIFKGEPAIGKTFRLGLPPNAPDYEYQVVGLVKNSKYIDLREKFLPIAYFPESQAEDQALDPDYLIRSNSQITTLIPEIKKVVSEINPNITLRFFPFNRQLNDSILTERVMATLSGFFGILAALLAMMGLYGVMSYMVTQRKNEIGIRMALGANRTRVIKIILREAALLLAIGLAIGIGGTLFAAKALGSLLFGLQPNDVTTYVIGAVALAVIGMLAGLIPAQRASRLVPMIALRSE